LGRGGRAWAVFPALAADAEAARRIPGRDPRLVGRAKPNPLDRVLRPLVSRNENMPIIYIESKVKWVRK